MKTVQILCAAALLLGACSYEKGNSDVGRKANERYDQDKAPETATPTAGNSRTGNVGTPDVLPVRGVTDPAGTASTRPPATDTTPTEAPGTAEEVAPATGTDPAAQPATPAPAPTAPTAAPATPAPATPEPAQPAPVTAPR